LGKGFEESQKTKNNNKFTKWDSMVGIGSRFSVINISQ
jgi:hypothetical protein